MFIVSWKLNSCVLLSGTLAFKIAKLFSFGAILYVQQLFYAGVTLPGID